MRHRAAAVLVASAVKKSDANRIRVAASHLERAFCTVPRYLKARNVQCTLRIKYDLWLAAAAGALMRRRAALIT